ncbi:MAG: amidohydrolase family protein [Planctomycetota bacterium]|nr:amidohydrolase family protein [Planctomycetota bacterium]
MVALSLMLSLGLALPCGDGLAIHCGKVMSMDDSDSIHAPGMIWVEDGELSYVGAVREVPEGWELRTEDEMWAMPGMVDLHTHIHSGGWGDTNDMVHSVNPELRAQAALRPANRLGKLACAAGVTCLLGIPGSGTNMSGFGVLYKTKTSGSFEEVVWKRVGGLKVAQDSNPARRAGTEGWGNCRASMGWTLEDVADKALASRREGRRDPALENLEKVMAGELPVLIHTAGSEGVVNTARMWSRKYNTHCVISHGSFDGWKVASVIAEWGVPVNHGPRTMDWFSSRNGRINGSGAEYVAAGVPLFSLNTDSSVIPQEEFFLQGSMTARLGGSPYQMLRALTIHPAKAFGLDDRVGSLEVGKDADIVLYDGDPLDPRTRVMRVWIEGELQYDRDETRAFF